MENETQTKAHLRIFNINIMMKMYILLRKCLVSGKVFHKQPVCSSFYNLIPKCF